MLDTIILTVNSIDVNKYKDFIFQNKLENHYKIEYKESYFQYSIPIPYAGDIDNIIYLSFNNTLNSLKIQCNYSKLLYNSQLKNVYHLEIQKFIDILYSEIKQYIPILRSELEISIIYRIDIPVNINVSEKPCFYTSIMDTNTLEKESYYKKVKYIDTLRYETINLKIQFYDKIKEIHKQIKNNIQLQTELLDYENILRLEFQMKFKGKKRMILNELDNSIYDIIENNYSVLLENILYRLTNKEFKQSNIYDMYKKTKASDRIRTNKLYVTVFKKYLEKPENISEITEFLQCIKETETKQTYYKYKTQIKNAIKSIGIENNTQVKELLQKLESEKGKYRKMKLIRIETTQKKQA